MYFNRLKKIFLKYMDYLKSQIRKIILWSFNVKNVKNVKIAGKLLIT